MGQREMRSRAVGQRHVLHEGFEVAVVFLEAVDVALHRVAQASLGAALSAPVEGRHREAAAAQVADRLEVLLDGFAAPLHQADGAQRLARRRPPARIAQPHAVGGQDAADRGAGRNRIAVDFVEFHAHRPCCRRSTPAARPIVIRADTGGAQARQPKMRRRRPFRKRRRPSQDPASEGGGIDAGPVAAIGGGCVCRGSRPPIELAASMPIGPERGPKRPFMWRSVSAAAGSGFGALPGALTRHFAIPTYCLRTPNGSAGNGIQPGQRRRA